MKRKFTLLATTTLLISLASSLYAQAPKAIITGPKVSKAGDLIILDASQSTGQKYLWRLLEDRSFLPVDNNLRCVFSAGVDKKETFHFVLIAAGTNANGGPEVDIATHDLVVEPRGTQTPSDPTVPPPSLPSPGKITKVTYIYEKDSNPVPKEVAKALQSINADSSLGIAATDFEQDSTNDEEKVPKQYVVALAAAKSLPCLVVQSGDNVVRIVQNPTTEKEVLEAVR